MKLSRLIDSVVELVSPAAGLRRARARAAVETILRHYEGASHSRRTAGWIAPSTSQNAASYGKLQVLRDRSRDIIRNNPWATNACELYESEIVGTGIVPTFVHKDKKVVLAATELWKAHCGTTAIDADGAGDIYALQALMVRTIFESGEVIVRRRRRRLSDGLPLPFQLELLETDHLDEWRDTLRLPNGGKISAGIQLTPLGAREGYWLYPEHPGELAWVAQTSTLVPASEVLHAYRRKRAKQLRGIPGLAAVLAKLRDLDEYEDAELLGKKIAACLTAFITDPAEGEMPTTGVQQKNVLPESLEPGALVNLPGGKSITFSTPPISQGYPDFVRANLRAIAAGVGVTYEALTGDWSNVNYSSARMGFIQNARAVDRFRWNVVVTQALNPIAAWFVLAAVLAGELPDEPLGVLWTPPRRAMLDPSKEVPARRDAVRAGFSSPSEILREDGQDPDQVWTEAAADFEKLRALGLHVESDPSVPMRGGPAPVGDASTDAPKP